MIVFSSEINSVFIFEDLDLQSKIRKMYVRMVYNS